MRCPYCGAEIPDEDQFCGDCGRRVREEPAGAAPVSAPTQAAPQATARRGGTPVALLAAVGVLLLVVIVGGGAWALGLFSPSGGGGGGGTGETPLPPGVNPLFEDMKFVMRSADEAMIYALMNRDDSVLGAFFTGPQLERLRANVADLRAANQTIDSTLDDQRDWFFQQRDDKHVTVTVNEVWSRTVYAVDGKVISRDLGRSVVLVCEIIMADGVWKVADCKPK
jgi:hypothetical protein